MEKTIEVSDQLIQELNESKSENIRLNSECFRFKKIIYILNEINVLTQPVVMNCKCDTNCDNIVNKLIVFRKTLEELKTNCDNNLIDDSFKDFDSIDLINKIIENNPKTNDKDIEECVDNDLPKPEQEVMARRKRGRPKKTSFFVSKKLVSKLTKAKRRVIRNKSHSNNNKNSKIKGKVVTEEGREVFLSRTKRLGCQWPGCDAMFRDREDLENHMWRHTGEKAYQCDWPGCNKAYSSRCYLKKHHDTHLDPNVFKCLHEGCQEAYVTSIELNQHFNKSHNGEKPFRCCWPGCCQQFSVKRNLKDHQIVHIDEKRFGCDWPGCEAAFKRKQQLDIHICEVHQAEGKLRCDWPGCDSTFSSHNKLKIHKMRHTGEKPYRCSWPDCEWSFRQHNHLSNHMLKHTGEKPWKCDQCGQQFQTKQAMRQHIDRKH